MEKPIRVQRKRTKGFKLPDNTVCVTRGTKWGNPFVVGETFIGNNEEAVKQYENWVGTGKTYFSITRDQHYFPPSLTEIKQLKGKNLACFCPLDTPCHADVLLKLANN